MKHIVSVSGGKDSALTLTLAYEKYGKDIIALFCDTGNEHQYVYDYLNYLEDKFNIKIHRLKADLSHRVINKRKFIANDIRVGRNKQGVLKRWQPKRKRVALTDGLKVSGNPMLDLCQWKGRFPSRKAQFCTQFLKTSLLERFQNEIYENNEVTIWTGVRRDESAARANIKEHEEVAEGFFFNRPLADMSTEDVFSMLIKYGIKRNTLYDLGFSRVGCMPCINARKEEIRLMAKLFPEMVEKIRYWERVVGDSSRRGLSSFFHTRTKGLSAYDAFNEANIDATIEWSKTSRGGKQYGFFNEEPSETCLLAEGACE